MKINPNKSKALKLHRLNAYHQLYIGHIPLEWVTSYKCLSVFFNAEQSATTHLRFLLEKAKFRLNIQRNLTSCKTGAGFKVRQPFYIIAIRSLVDNCALVILTLRPDQATSLETIQSRARRTILASPRWTSLVSLRVETYLPSLHTRLRQLSITLIK